MYTVVKVVAKDDPFSLYIDLPDSPSFSIIIEHPVLMMPYDIFGRPSHHLSDHTLQLDGAATFVKLLADGFVPFVHDLDFWNCKGKNRFG